MMIPVSYERRDAIGVLRIDNPPVNALSAPVVAGLIEAFAQFEADPSSRALVVYCAGRTFVAGGDITAFERPDFSAQPYNALLGRLEACSRPVVAALHGAALGGGLELALACHYRVAALGTRVGLPEVKLGLLPGSLGTQRLPRLVGASLALDMISTGRPLDAAAAGDVGLIDHVDAGDPLEFGLSYARALLERGAAPRRCGQLTPKDCASPAIFEKALADARKKPDYPALEAIVNCVRAAVTLPFAEGEKIEAREFERLRASRTSKALRHMFFAEREAAKIPGLAKDLPLRPIRSVGIVGAGTMGGGIAMNFANAGMPTVIVEASAAALERGLGLVRTNYEASAAKGKLTVDQVAARIGLLKGSLDQGDLADCDLVIEAVFENMDLKKQVMARLGRVCKPGAIIATNTSTLDVDVLADVSGRPGDVLGTHFFSPANVMRLVEVVRGARTAPDALATVMKLATTIGKVAAVSGVCYGFIGNRMAEVYMREAEFLLMEGAEPRQIDHAIESIGMAMGPCRMLDMAGVDVGAKTVIERGKEGGSPDDPAYRAVVRELFELGRYGQKTGAGYYRYEGRSPLPDPELTSIRERLAARHGIAPRPGIEDSEIVERLLYPLINEGAAILAEGIAYRPGDIDVIWVAGYGFPDHRGGPMFMADDIGLPVIVERLAHYAKTRGNAYNYWTVSPLLADRAASGRRISES
jgi:3-hydroxyacyl-CoA dehydrogenase